LIIFRRNSRLESKDKKAGKIHVWYYDEVDIRLYPNRVYTWLPKQNAYELPACYGNELTIAVFLQTDNTLQAYSHSGSMTSELFIAYGRIFSKVIPQVIKP
jgi:hypothetical protein